MVYAAKLKELLDDGDRSLSTLSGARVVSLMGNLRGSKGQLLQNELQILSEFFADTTGQRPGVDLAVRIQRLTDAALLLSYAAVLPSALDALESLHICDSTDEDYCGLRLFVEGIHNLNNVYLKDATTRLQVLQKMLTYKLEQHPSEQEEYRLQVHQLQLVVSMAQAQQVRALAVKELFFFASLSVETHSFASRYHCRCSRGLQARDLSSRVDWTW
jgi:hypothetical protein